LTIEEGHEIDPFSLDATNSPVFFFIMQPKVFIFSLAMFYLMKVKKMQDNPADILFSYG
jgi:hypothetical protein